MAIQHQTRFLLGRSPAEDVGMWYMFIPPAAIAEITPGQLHYGPEAGPALRVGYRRQPPATEGKRPPKAVSETVYLAFGDETARERVWADLLADDRPSSIVHRLSSSPPRTPPTPKRP